jgi:hypothetical protein
MTTPTISESMPLSIEPTRYYNCWDKELVLSETSISWEPLAFRPYWAREYIYQCSNVKQLCNSCDSRGRLLVAYSLNKSGKVVRAWYMTAEDQKPQSNYRLFGGCPCEAVWLASIKVATFSQSAAVFLGHPHF